MFDGYFLELVVVGYVCFEYFLILKILLWELYYVIYINYVYLLFCESYGLVDVCYIFY